MLTSGRRFQTALRASETWDTPFRSMGYEERVVACFNGRRDAQMKRAPELSATGGRHANTEMAHVVGAGRVGSIRPHACL